MQLRPHQQEALAAILAAVRQGRRRMTVVAASGSGKTLIAQRVSAELASRGATLVLVPTKALVVQTARKWREAGYRGLLIGVCSLSQDDSGLSSRELTMTSDPAAIAAQVAGSPGPAAVVATYASLHHLAAAHSSGLGAWDLLIADEAHRTCAAFGEGWGTVHDDTLLPAATRLYMTATPRVWAARADAGLLDAEDRTPLATMEHEEVFGPIVYRLGLADAIERGIVADYQVLVVVVDDQDRDLLSILNDPHPAGTAHHDGLRNAAVQVAVVRAIHEHKLRRILAFHNRVEAATGFARTLPQTAAKVHDPLRRDHLWSHAVYGEQDDTVTQSLLAAFDDPGQDVAVLSNARMLNEGVDLPDLDAVVFAAPRYSTIDAVQGVSRGLRQMPGAGKRTTLLIPVYLPETGDGSNILESSDFAALIAILQALRSHDESFMDRVTLPPPTRPNTLITRDLLYSEPERAAQLARVLGLKVLIPAAGTWAEGLRSATDYHRSFSHLNVPFDYTDEDGFGLGQWTAAQRLHHLLGALTAERRTALERLDMCWTLPTTTQAMLDHARLFARTHGHLAVRPSTVVGGYALGKWLGTCRTRASAGSLDVEVQSALDRIDQWWNPPWPPAWQSYYALAKACYRGRGQTWSLAGDEPSQHDRAVVGWMRTQEATFFRLTPEQQDLLLQIGAQPHTGILLPPSARGTGTGGDFGLGLSHAARFLAEQGHLDIPAGHQAVWKRSASGPASSFPLGAWFHEHLASLASGERRALNAIRELARRAAEFGQAPGESRPPQARRSRTRAGAGQQDTVADLTGRPHAMAAAYRKARRGNTPTAFVLQRADGWSARVDTSTTKLVVVQPEAALSMQVLIERAVRAGKAAWGSTGPVHFSIGGVPDEETARSWAVQLYGVTHEHLRNVISYYGFAEKLQ
ncbi:DEAD/DEAH box helicase [Streptomyces platensis]|uniref:DEAD/DEAH box helicase n=1 Tax=Streptomyces platensis TaxID=58346 RepID=A0AAE6NR74_STRPT|nr:DEAD/DEAH box helicase [Streptomyces platensis]OSY38314.1 Helicase associated domain protein [Streptomyces platensis]QEV56480.1 DEAD/DEAH box helicase [Streptomyces platensis]